MAEVLGIVRGTTSPFSIPVVDQDGRPYTLEEGQVLVWGLKRNKNDAECVLVKPVTHLVNDVEYYLELNPADTADLPTGRYYYDVGLQHGNSVFYNVIEAAPFDIRPNITKLGDIHV